MRFFLHVFVFSYFFQMMGCEKKIILDSDIDLKIGLQGHCAFQNCDTEIEEQLINLSVYFFMNTLANRDILPNDWSWHILTQHERQLEFLKIVRDQQNLGKSRKKAIEAAGKKIMEDSKLRILHKKYTLSCNYGPKFLARARTLIFFKKSNAQEFFENLFLFEKEKYDLKDTFRYYDRFELACKTLSEVYEKNFSKNKNVDIIDCAMPEIKKALSK